MAGESPDRSKQRESSEEPTSGSAGPVPGARGESGAGVRDPRLAVARERDSTVRGGVDTATRVFQRPQLPADADAADADAEVDSDASTSDAAAEAPSEPEAPADGTDGTGSTRLRAAVAAWVASADEGEGESEGVEGAAEERGPDTGPEADAPTEAPEGTEEPSADATDDAGPDKPSRAVGEAPEAAGGASSDSGEDAPGPESAQESEPERDREPKTGAEPGTGTESGAESNAGTEAEPDADAVSAAGSKSGADTESEAEIKSGIDSGSEVESGAGAESAAGSKAGTESRAESKSGTGTESGAKPDAEAVGVAGSKSAPESRADLKSGTAPKPEPESGAEGAPDTKSGAESEAKSGTAPKPEPEPEAGADTESEAGAGVKSGTESGAKTESESTPDSRPEPDAEAEVGADAASAPTPGADADDAARKPFVDQPTAVFKAVRPPAAPPVDQPTTMLKLGDLAAVKPKGDKRDADSEADAKADIDADAKTGTDADANAESVSERTSKFVALRQLDDPSTRKPPPAAGPPRAPAAQPSGTPAVQSPKAPAAEATAVVPQVGPERTTQQPLPPMPPLDLLAELTNTPPPRDTAVRTIARRVKIWTPVAVLLVIVFAVVQVLRPLPSPELTLTAEDSYTFDGTAAALPWPSEGQGWMDVNGVGTMGNFGEQKPVAIGSVAKAMTAYIVLKDHPLKSGQAGPKITVDALAEKEAGYWKDGESTLTTVKKGDVLTEQQAISAIMIPSANNIARLLARWDSGTEAAFIKKMNDTAKALGMKNTTYTDASGLKETTVSTAEDQVKLGNALVKIPALMDITKLPEWYDPTGKKWINYNRLVPYNGAIGIKTGTTTAAGGNLLFAATKEVGGETAIVVGAILGQHTAPIIDTVNAVSKTAMIAARDELLSSKILKKGDVVGYVDDGLGGHTPVVLSKDVTAVGWAGRKVELSFAAAADLPHSAKAGTAVGSLTVGDGKGGAVKVPVQLQQDLVEPGFDKKLTRVG
ncbi:D-alanyl-D-alanine carboxypeptidase [Streptomyces sp. SID12501]|uniref:D-alanyl-D-alanine carboxypeptidase n=1 Tax=Streptomyces sp. SID12501 TaxID=2706042 RepID=UPI0031B9D1CC